MIRSAGPPGGAVVMSFMGLKAWDSSLGPAIA